MSTSETLSPEANGVDTSHWTSATAKKCDDLPAENDQKEPQLLDLTAENHTETVLRMSCQQSVSPRLNYILRKLVQVLHDFVRDVELQTTEWEMTWQFLTSVGQISDGTRHEMVMLSDILGISALVDTITYPRVEGATESSVLGPFFDGSAREIRCGESICKGNRGEVTIVRGRDSDVATGEPISNALLDVWETDGDGFYDIQYAEMDGPDFRAKLYTREDGTYNFLACKPVSYPIPNDGPVGMLLRTLGRHWMRPAHVHFQINHPGYNTLVTALYTRDDKYIASDTVFGVKSSLMVDYQWTEDIELGKKDNIPNPENGFWLLEFDFKLMPKTAPKKLKVND